MQNCGWYWLKTCFTFSEFVISNCFELQNTNSNEKTISKEKANYSNRVHFIRGTENSIPPGIKFDVIIMNFYLDLFTTESLDLVLEKIQRAMKINALWLVTDFINAKKWWQYILLEAMYSFFKITCSIEATRLPNWNQSLLRKNLIKKKSTLFFRKFINATVYQTL